VDASFGDASGADAVRRALRLRDGEFRVELNVHARQRTIFEPWSKLVLDEMVAGDEAARTAADDEVVIEQEEPMLPKTQPQPVRRKSALPIAITSAAVVAAAIGGLFYWRGVKEQQEAAAISEREAAAAVAQHVAEAKQAARPHVPGVTDTEITFGISAPFSGPAKELGRGMKSGIDIAFAAANEAGGINGRKLKLVALDDGYEPERTKAAMKELAEGRKVFGFVGNVGTPTAEVAVPYALEKKMLFFGPFTGAGLLRHEPPDRYVFNYRASYAEETAAMVKYLVSVRRISPDDIAVFAQQDGYGDAGFNGVARMLRKYNRDPQKALRVGYQRNTSDVNQAVEQILGQRKHIKAVIMVATYKAAAHFVEKVKAERPDMIFSNVSFVGSQALADELMSMGPKVADGVIVTQVVPLPQSKSTAVLRYQELLPRYSLGEKPDFVSLEGYLAANLLIEGLRKAGHDVTTETLIDALEGLRGVDLGVGAPMSFGMSEHQASHKVWGTQLDATGVFRNIDLE
jgi:branched-chain amino acid transport system substrate-binding protein